MESVESMKSAIDRVERLLAEGRCAFVAIDIRQNRVRR